MHKRRIIIIIATLLLGLAFIHLVNSISLASPAYQTIPTMPPPTKSPTVTPTVARFPTATHARPTSTSPQATSLPPTQTAQAAATETAIVSTSTPTTTPPGVLITVRATQPGVGVMTPLVAPTQATPPISTPTESSTSSAGSGANYGLYGLIGAGVVVILAFLVWLWPRARKKQP